MEVKDYSENYGEGWIKLYRSLAKHWLWQDKPFTKGQAWIDILLECNHADHKVNIGNEIVFCKRGESVFSLDTWAKRWGWHKSRVRRFLELLKNDSMIDLKSTHNTTHLIVINYDIYQTNRNANRTPIERKQNEAETKPTPNKNVKNEKNEKKVNTKNGKIPNPKILFDIYNEENMVLPSCIAFTEKRKEKSRTRLKHFHEDIDTYLVKFREAVKKAQSNNFLTGQGNRGWKASFDWFVENDENAIKVIEGKYDG